MKRYWLIFSLSWLLLSCSSSVPEYVIEKEALESLLVDIHLSEAVIETNNITKVPEKKKIREAIFLRHGITQEQFDTTLVWYGHHMVEYMEIYERVIERLEAENDNAKDLLAQENSRQMSQPGDSVDIWKMQHYHIFDTRIPDNLLAFEVYPDENFERRDYFELRFKVVLLPRQSIDPQVYMVATHLDKSMVFNQLDITEEGWYSLPLQTDSAHNLRHLQGYILLPMQAIHERMYIDSIALVRRHYNEDIPVVEGQKSLSKKVERNTLRRLNLKQ